MGTVPGNGTETDSSSSKIKTGYSVNLLPRELQVSMSEVSFKKHWPKRFGNRWVARGRAAKWRKEAQTRAQG
jgi:hypothetical protein